MVHFADHIKLSVSVSVLIQIHKFEHWEPSFQKQKKKNIYFKLLVMFPPVRLISRIDPSSVCIIEGIRLHRAYDDAICHYGMHYTLTSKICVTRGFIGTPPPLDSAKDMCMALEGSDTYRKRDAVIHRFSRWLDFQNPLAES